jgi:hypothetical protein
VQGFYPDAKHQEILASVLELYEDKALPWTSDASGLTWMLSFDKHFGGIDAPPLLADHRKTVREMIRQYQESEAFLQSGPNWQLDLTPGHEFFDVTVSLPGWKGTPLHFDDIGFNEQVDFADGSIFKEFWRYRALSVLYYARVGSERDGANLRFAQFSHPAEGGQRRISQPGPEEVPIPANTLGMFYGGRGNAYATPSDGFESTNYVGRAHQVTSMAGGDAATTKRIALSIFYRYQRVGEQLTHPIEMAARAIRPPS